jgi:hypothetical protein
MQVKKLFASLDTENVQLVVHTQGLRCLSPHCSAALISYPFLPMLLRFSSDVRYLPEDDLFQNQWL